MSAQYHVIHESEDSWEVRLVKWIIYKVIIPLIVMFVIWPISEYSLGLHHAYEKAFAHGDLLIFAAFVLIEVVIEGEHKHVKNWRFQLGRHTAFVLAFVSLIFFIVVKIDVLRSEEAPNIGKMYMYSCVGWFMAVLAGIISIYAFWKTAYDRTTKELDHLAQEIKG